MTPEQIAADQALVREGCMGTSEYKLCHDVSEAAARLADEVDRLTAEVADRRLVTSSLRDQMHMWHERAAKAEAQLAEQAPVIAAAQEWATADPTMTANCWGVCGRLRDTLRALNETETDR